MRQSVGFSREVEVARTSIELKSSGLSTLTILDGDTAKLSAAVEILFNVSHRHFRKDARNQMADQRSFHVEGSSPSLSCRW